MSKLFTEWLEEVPPTAKGVSFFGEQSGARATAMKEFKRLLANHFVGEATVAKAGGYKKAAKVILHSLPTYKQTQSGDLAELIATEYVAAKTSFSVPILKLRWKSDRQMPMHGNDVIAVDTSSRPVRVLKGESKSRANFTADVVKEAIETLDAHNGRPNPSTLAFITKRLYEENRDAEAKIFQALQADGALSGKQIVHLIFTLTGNDPCSHLANAAKPKQAGIKRDTVAVMVTDHGKFISSVFAKHGAKS